jgi:hypothetical protein
VLTFQCLSAVMVSLKLIIVLVSQSNASAPHDTVGQTYIPTRQTESLPVRFQHYKCIVKRGSHDLRCSGPSGILHRDLIEYDTE